MKNQYEKKWTIAYDSNGNDFDYHEYYNTKEEAIKAFMDDLKDGGFNETKKRGYFWVGQCREHSISYFFDAENVIENAWETAQDTGGEYAEDYLQDVSQSAKDELQTLLTAWAEKHELYPNFFEIINSEKINID